MIRRSNLLGAQSRSDVKKWFDDVRLCPACGLNSDKQTKLEYQMHRFGCFGGCIFPKNDRRTLCYFLPSIFSGTHPVPKAQCASFDEVQSKYHSQRLAHLPLRFPFSEGLLVHSLPLSNTGTAHLFWVNKKHYLYLLKMAHWGKVGIFFTQNSQLQ